MKKKVIWLVVSGWMVAALLLASCAPAVVEEAPKAETPKAEVPKEKVEPEVVAPKEESNMVKWTGTKVDGTVVERMIEKPQYGGIHVTTGPVEPVIWDDFTIRGTRNWQNSIVQETLHIKDWTRGPAGTEEWLPQISLVPIPPEPIYVGQLAESWEILDGQTILWHIRKGVRYGLDPSSEASQLVGGRQLTAADVVFSTKRNFTAYMGRFVKLSDMENMENSMYVSPDDPWTVVMKLAPGYSAHLLRVIGGSHNKIIAPEVIEKYGEILDWRNVVGTGPFILKDYVNASSLTFERNPDYWMRDPFFPENQLPYVDGVKHLIIPDISTQMAALRTGKVDNLPTDGMGDTLKLYKEDADQLLKINPELEFARYISGSPDITIAMRFDTKPFDDIRVRRALNMAVNHQEILDDYYLGDAVQIFSPIPPLPEYERFFIPLDEMPESVQELYQYKPDKARQLLAEAGYPDGFKTSIIARASDADLLSVIKNYWADIGVDLEIQVKDGSVWSSIGVRKTHTQMYAFTGGMQGGTIALVFAGGLGNYSRVDMAPQQEVRLKFGSAEYYLTDKAPEALLEPVGGVTPNWVVFASDRAEMVLLPEPYKYIFWQPWLKNYYGANFIIPYAGFDWPRFVWIDQELKKSMGR